jgi:hypothetical protein
MIANVRRRAVSVRGWDMGFGERNRPANYSSGLWQHSSGVGRDA